MASDITATQVRVSWTPPDFDGGTPLIGYLIEYLNLSNSEWSKVNLKECTNPKFVRGLENRTKYRFRVSAQNQVGSSTPSILSDVYETLGKACFYFYMY